MRGKIIVSICAVIGLAIVAIVALASTAYKIPSNQSSVEGDIIVIYEAKITMTEVEGKDIEGKSFVILVVPNRGLDDKSSDTIENAIYQYSNHYFCKNKE